MNPLHAIHNRRPFNTSPYLPNCIFYQNFIYLDVEGMEDYKRCRRAQRQPVDQEPAREDSCDDARNQRVQDDEGRIHPDACARRDFEADHELRCKRREDQQHRHEEPPARPEHHPRAGVEQPDRRERQRRREHTGPGEQYRTCCLSRHEQMAVEADERPVAGR